MCYLTNMNNWQGISFAWRKEQLYSTPWIINMVVNAGKNSVMNLL